jgi:hypothetical protein
MSGQGQLIFSTSSGANNELRKPGLGRGAGNIYQAQGRNDGPGSRKSGGSFDLTLRQSSLERTELLQRKEAEKTEGPKKDNPAFQPLRSNRDARSDKAAETSEEARYLEDAVRADATADGHDDDQATDFGLLANLSGLVQEEYTEEHAEVDETSELTAFDRLLATSRDSATGGSKQASQGQSLEDVSLQFLQGRVDGLQLDPAQGIQGKSGLELLNFQELMDPDIQIEAGDDLMERLQQALSTGNTAALDDAGKIVAPQVVRGLAALMRGNGVSEMRLQLQPKDLGEIELRVRALEGIVRGEITVQSTEVKQLLESQIDRLRVALAQQGFELEGFDIEVADRPPFEHAGDGWGQDSPGRGDSRTGQDAANTAAALATNDDGVTASDLTLNGDHEVNLVA